MSEKSRDGMGLFAAILEQNARDAQHVSDSLLVYEAERAAELAVAFVAFYDLVDEAASVVTSRKLEWVLSQYGADRDIALRYLQDRETERVR